MVLFRKIAGNSFFLAFYALLLFFAGLYTIWVAIAWRFEDELVDIIDSNLSRLSYKKTCNDKVYGFPFRTTLKLCRKISVDGFFSSMGPATYDMYDTTISSSIFGKKISIKSVGDVIRENASNNNIAANIEVVTRENLFKSSIRGIPYYGDSLSKVRSINVSIIESDNSKSYSEISVIANLSELDNAVSKWDISTNMALSTNNEFFSSGKLSVINRLGKLFQVNSPFLQIRFNKCDLFLHNSKFSLEDSKPRTIGNVEWINQCREDINNFIRLNTRFLNMNVDSALLGPIFEKVFAAADQKTEDRETVNFSITDREVIVNDVDITKEIMHFIHIATVNY